MVVSIAAAKSVWNTATLQPEHSVVLRAGGDGQRLFAMKGRNLDRCAERALGEGHFEFAMYVVALSCEERMRFDADDEFEIPRRLSWGRAVACTGNDLTSTVLYSLGHLNFDLSTAGRQPGAAARFTRRRRYTPPSGAGWTRARAGNTEEPDVAELNAPRTPATLTGTQLGLGGSPGSMAALTVIDALVAERLTAAECCLFES